jgi:hypothetical protein
MMPGLDHARPILAVGCSDRRDQFLPIDLGVGGYSSLEDFEAILFLGQ